MGDQNLAYDYPVLGAFWTVMWVFLWVLWIVVLFRVIVDIFRDRTMGGWGKAAWLFFVIVLPFLGVFAYVVARGRGMAERQTQETRERQEAMDSYIRQTAASGTTSADELTKLSALKAKGELSEEEFQRAKELALR